MRCILFHLQKKSEVKVQEDVKPTPKETKIYSDDDSDVWEPAPKEKAATASKPARNTAAAAVSKKVVP